MQLINMAVEVRKLGDFQCMNTVVFVELLDYGARIVIGQEVRLKVLGFSL